jgi:hypothetical protein
MRLALAAAAFAALAALAAPVAARVVHDSPFSCDLSRLSAADRARKSEIGARLAAARLGAQELRDGYAFRFPGDTATLQALNEWIVTERVCCPFFDFDLRLAREDGAVTLRLTGRKGTKAFIKADFGRWLN